MAKIKIHLNGLEYTLIEASPLYTIDAFIGAIGKSNNRNWWEILFKKLKIITSLLGGIFGLFLGASLFSFIEIFALLSSFGLIIIKHRKEKQKIGVRNQSGKIDVESI